MAMNVGHKKKVLLLICAFKCHKTAQTFITKKLYLSFGKAKLTKLLFKNVEDICGLVGVDLPKLCCYKS